MIDFLEKLLVLPLRYSWPVLISFSAASFFFRWFFYAKLETMYTLFTALWSLSLFCLCVKGLASLLEIVGNRMLSLGGNFKKGWQSIRQKRENRKRHYRMLDSLMLGPAENAVFVLFNTSIGEYEPANSMKYIVSQKQSTPDGNAWLQDFFSEIDKYYDAMPHTGVSRLDLLSGKAR